MTLPANSSAVPSVRWLFATASIRRDFAETLLVRLSLTAVSAVVGILMTRALGVEGRGLFTTVATVTAIAAQFSNLGLHAANSYFAATRAELRRTLFGNSLLAATASILCGTGVALLVDRWGSSEPLPPLLLLLAIIQVPMQVAPLLLQNLLVGMGHVRLSNALDILASLVPVSLFSALLVWGVVRVDTAVLAGTIAGLLPTLFAIVAVASVCGAPTCSLPVIKTSLPYSFRAYLAALCMFLVLKLDLLMVDALAGRVSVGHYAVAVSLCDMLLMVPQVLGTVLFPRLAASETETVRWSATKKGFVAVVALLGAGCLALEFVADPLIPMLFGETFRPSIVSLRWLLPGVVCLAANTILMHYFAARGMPLVTVWSPAIACAINVLLNLWFIPRWGAPGAAMTSSIAYGLMLTLSLGYILVNKGKTAAASVMEGGGALTREP